MIEGLLKKKPKEAELQDQVKSLEIKIAEAEATLTAKTEHLNTLEHSLANIKAQIESTQLEKTNLEDLKVSLSDECANLSGKIAALVSVLSNIEAPISNLAKSIDDSAVSAVESTEKAFAALTAFVQTETERKTKSIDDEVKASKKILDVLKTEIASFESAKQTLSSVVTTAEQIAAQANLNLEKASHFVNATLGAATVASENVANYTQSVQDIMISSLTSVNNVTQKITEVETATTSFADTIAYKLNDIIKREQNVQDRERMVAQKETAVEALVKSITTSQNVVQK